MVKNLAKSRFGLASRRVVFPLPTTGLEPRSIGLQQWHRLPVHERAPNRSVAVVDVIGHRVIALVIDTVHGRELWLIVGHASKLALLYDGMLGGGHDRGTLVISSPLRARLKQLDYARRDAAPSSQSGDDDDCESPVVLEEVHSSYPGGGSPGVVVVASVVADVVAGFAEASEADLSDGDDTQGVIVVSPHTP